LPISSTNGKNEQEVLKVKQFSSLGETLVMFGRTVCDGGVFEVYGLAYIAKAFKYNI